MVDEKGMTFTPGPWHNNTFLVSAEDGSEICHTGGTRRIGQHYQPDEAEANARLIAAAPDLYEACKQALDALGETHVSVPKIIKQALGKADGR